jgi:hypothetical protein
MEIVEMYYKATPNAENRESLLVPQSKDSPNFEKDQKPS